MKWLRLKYWWVWNIAVRPAANWVSSPASLLLVAFSGSAKCFEPGPHPVHTQARGAGERVRHAAVSGWVCCLSHTPAPTNGNSDPLFLGVSCISGCRVKLCAILRVSRWRSLVRLQVLKRKLQAFMFSNCFNGVLFVFNISKLPGERSLVVRG